MGHTWQTGELITKPLLDNLAQIPDIGTPGTPTGDALKAAYVPKWQPNTAYAAGDPVLNPSGQTVTANVSFTSGSSYSPANWTVVSGGGTSGTAVSVDGSPVSTLNIDSTPVTAASIGADAAGAAAAAQTAAQTYATGVAAGLALIFGA